MPQILLAAVVAALLAMASPAQGQDEPTGQGDASGSGGTSTTNETSNETAPASGTEASPASQSGVGPGPGPSNGPPIVHIIGGGPGGHRPPPVLAGNPACHVDEDLCSCSSGPTNEPTQTDLSEGRIVLPWYPEKHFVVCV